jgi:hypothetical protein
MPSFALRDFVTIRDAVDRDDVPYTARWVKHLIRVGKVEGTKIGTKRRGQWLVYLPSLLEYVGRMRELGTMKHAVPAQSQKEEGGDG